MALKVLIVEDDPINLELMCEVLSSVEAEVQPINDSEYAESLITKERFDGIFLDLEMPRLTGFELAYRIRQSSWNRSTPIIVVTGREDQKTMQQAFDVGATFFLQKPIDRQKLLLLFRTVRGTMFDNRRRYIRVPLSTTVICETGNRTLKGMSWNISQGGILVAADLRSGEQVKLSICLPAAGVTVEAFGVVARVDEQQRAGIQFTKVSPQGRDRIRELIDQIAKELPESQV